MAVPQSIIDEYRASLAPVAEAIHNGASVAEAMKIPLAPPSTSNHKIRPKRGEEIFEGTDYPRDWSGFIGQAQAKEQLTVMIASAKHRGTRIEHTLLASGSHGIGKSTLATLLAYKAGVGVIQASGLQDIDKARRILKSMRDGDILYVDEVHSLVAGGKSKAEGWLLPFMTDGKLYSETGAETMPDIAIVGATTDAGRLPETMLTRFMVKPKLVPYTAEESALIVASLAGRMNVPVPEDCLAPIARASGGNPRDMRSILVAVRDQAFAYPELRDAPNLAKAFSWAGFSFDGLHQIAQDMLMTLLAQKNHTASIESIQALLGEPGPLKHYEQALMKAGMLTVTGRGRQLTGLGIRRATELMEEEVGR